MWKETLGIRIKLRQAENKVYLSAQAQTACLAQQWIGILATPTPFSTYS